MMYYRLYRRRQQICVLITFIVVFYYFGEKDESTNSPKNENSKRINIYNYVPPKPCGNCPGENGTGVYLTVSVNK